MDQSPAAGFTGLTDLAAERYGGKTLAANDEFFAEKENLLKPGRGVFIEGKYTDRGKWMDGWETRRKRGPGHDWCIIELGLPGAIAGLDIDTNHFLGNHPPFASVEASCLEPGQAAAEAVWTEILPKSPLNPGAQNFFGVSQSQVWTHVRLNIFPDGGVARFRVYGTVSPRFVPRADGLVDLVALSSGGRAVACSDMFFSHMQNLIQPGDSRFMGDGWETRRRRGPGHDWIILKLAKPGTIEEVELFTTHYKGNFPDGFSLEAVDAAEAGIDLLNVQEFTWREVIPFQKLGADARFSYVAPIKQVGVVSHLRVNMYSDGGIARFRAWGRTS